MLKNIFYSFGNSLMTFLYRMKCEYLGIDIQDDMGRHEVGFVENTVKTPVGPEGEGCLFEARFFINKVVMINLIRKHSKK